MGKARINPAEELLKRKGKRISVALFKRFALQLTGPAADHFKPIASGLPDDVSSVELSFSKKTLDLLQISAMPEKAGVMTLDELSGLYGVEIESAALGELGKSKQTFFAEVTRRILALVKKGDLPWRKPWGKVHEQSSGPISFANYISNKKYRGVNWNMCMMFGGGDKYFLTENQVKERGGKVVDRERSIPICYFVKTVKQSTVEIDKPEGGKETITFTEVLAGLRWYSVYPLSATEGVKPINRATVVEQPKEKKGWEPIEMAQKILASYPPKQPDLRHSGNEAFYNRVGDFVNMPPQKAFKAAPLYYSVLFHELIHSTGAPHRLNRTKGKQFGDKLYAAEELVAELGSSFLCSICKIDYYTLNNSAAYLKNWSGRLIEELSKDKQLFVKTQFAAIKAAKYMMGSFYKEWEKLLDNKSPKSRKSKQPSSKTKKTSTAVQKAKTTADRKPKIREAKPQKEKAPRKLTNKEILKQFQPVTQMDYLAEFMRGKRIKTSSWDQNADRNLRTKRMALNWFSATGWPMDKIAYWFNSETGFDMEEREIIDLMIDLVTSYPGGPISYMRDADEWADRAVTMFGLEGQNKPVLRIKAIPTKLAKRLNLGNGNVVLYNGDSRFGIVHILNDPKKGFQSEKEIIDFVSEVAKNFTEIRKSHTGRPVLVKRQNNEIAILEIIQNDNALSVVTAFEAKESQILKMPLIWLRPRLLGTLSTSLRQPALQVITNNRDAVRITVGSGDKGNTNLQKPSQKASGLGEIVSASDLNEIKYETLQLQEPYFSWLGAIPTNFDMMVDGAPGGGKSTLLLQFAEHLAKDLGQKVLYVSKEEFGAASLVEKVKRLGIKNVAFTNTITPDANLGEDYDTVFIDSITDLRFDVDDYKKLREKNPDVAFVLVLQRTKNGQFRGTNEWPHEVEITAKVQDGFTWTEKNRYNPNPQTIQIPGITCAEPTL
jgi:antirestriction protein ArdC